MVMDNYQDKSETFPNRYFDRYLDREVVKILPGEYYATTEDTVIVTVLDSCHQFVFEDHVNTQPHMNQAQ